ncbi:MULTISPECIES: hypothetical protein [Atlantibacter]|uniref:hypothetical protein n=1 Tax=Atlantibacter TaxID=1903434 RepID=UPI0022B7861F|nr:MULTISPECIES: hypothetical protein [Atlantibacter]MCZ7833131.1 hypothetical protein [Atlantibacter hermannii]
MRIFYFLLLMICYSAYSSPYPIISSLNVQYRSDGAYYYITQRIVNIGSAGDSVVPYGYFVGLGHKHYNGSAGWVGSLQSETITTASATNPYQTRSQMAMNVYNTVGKSITTINHTGSNGFPECVGYMIGPPNPASYAHVWTYWDQTQLPGGCLMVPPANQWCKITTPELTLEHGTITLRQAEGDIASTSMGLQCTTATAVTFNLITQDSYVYLDEGKSEITVNDQPLNTKIDLPQGNSQMPIKDLLTGITTEGFHTGSSVLVMMPY